jgi:hypothetical protein
VGCSLGRGVPRRAAVEKQNCGVNAGWRGWETISSVAMVGEEGGCFDQMRFATVDGCWYGGFVGSWIGG